MRPTQTVELLALISQLCPSQRIDSHTPDAWHPLLSALDVEDCVAAVYDTAAERRYVDVADVVQGAKARARRRVVAAGEPELSSDPDDVEAWLAERQAAIAAVAHPSPSPTHQELTRG